MAKWDEDLEKSQLAYNQGAYQKAQQHWDAAISKGYRPKKGASCEVIVAVIIIILVIAALLLLGGSADQVGVGTAPTDSYSTPTPELAIWRGQVEVNGFFQWATLCLPQSQAESWVAAAPPGEQRQKRIDTACQ